VITVTAVFDIASIGYVGIPISYMAWARAMSGSVVSVTPGSFLLRRAAHSGLSDSVSCLTQVAQPPAQVMVHPHAPWMDGCTRPPSSNSHVPTRRAHSVGGGECQTKISKRSKKLRSEPLLDSVNARLGGRLECRKASRIYTVNKYIYIANT
jgi:hypothetical protein